MVDRTPSENSGPLKDLEQWDDDLRRRYPEPANELAPNSAKAKEQFRDYRAEVRPEVREFYRLNHTHQTVDFVRAKRAEYLRLNRRQMGLWDGLEFLNTLVDDSDPDTSLPQIEHLLQTAEAIRRDGHPRWFILTGLIHDFGKVLCLFGEPQWAVVGDTFPVGCACSDEIVFPEFLADNPDSQVPELSNALRHLRRGLRTGQRADVLGARRVHVPRRQGLPARRGAVHDPLPLVLSRSPRRRVCPSDERRGSQVLRRRAGVQPVRPVHQSRRAPRRRQAAARSTKTCGTSSSRRSWRSRFRRGKTAGLRRCRGHSRSCAVTSDTSKPPVTPWAQ